MATDMEYPLRQLAESWSAKIKIAERFAKPFHDDARECLKYVKGTNNPWAGKVLRAGQTVEGELDEVPAPSHRMTVNKAYEYKAINGPLLYYQNPQFRVTARKPPNIPLEVLGDPNDPQLQMVWQTMGQRNRVRNETNKTRAALLQFVLNYYPNETGLKTQSRLAIDQALLCGMGILWPELIEPPFGGPTLLSASWVDIFDFVCDPDMGTIQDAYWWARRRVRPVWEVAQERELDPEKLNGNYESATGQSTKTRQQRLGRRDMGHTNDLIEYWEVYSRMGAGTRMKTKQPIPGDVRELIDDWGPYVYLEISEGVPFPLNMSTQRLAGTQDNPAVTRAYVSWPTPYYLDDRPPFVHLGFHQIPGDLYPTAPLKPGLPELKFMSWVMSHLASKIRVTCRDFMAVMKAANESLKMKILHGSDLTLLEIEGLHGKVSDVIAFLQHPPMNRDIWDVYAATTSNWEKRVGLTPEHYGISVTQDRSATAAQTKRSQMNVRPSDMLALTEEFMTDLGRHWALAARWYLDGDDVEPILGPIGRHFWEQLVMSADISEVTREIDLRVEAGSTKRPDFETELQNMSQFGGLALPHLLQYASQWGDYTPANNLMFDWAKAMQLDPERYQMQNMPAMVPVDANESAEDRKAKSKKSSAA